MKTIAKGLALISTVILSGCLSEPTTPAELFKSKCATCHSLKAGQHKIGPSLHGIFGRKAGSTDYTKYKALKDVDFIWDDITLDAWITDPKKYLGKPTAMTVKMKKKEQRQMILDYLKKG